MRETFMGRLAKKLISQVTDPIKIEVCKGCLFGCPHAVIEPKDLEMEILDLIDHLGLEEELKHYLPEEDVLQPSLRISISGCVNGCSRPHIKDIGIEGIVLLNCNQEKCNLCGACANVCQEDAIQLTDAGFNLDSQKCLSCGECARVCPTGALKIEKSGNSLLLGGSLGRHPKIGQPVAKFLSNDQTVQKLRQIFLMLIKEHQSGCKVVEAIRRVNKKNLKTSTGQ